MQSFDYEQNLQFFRSLRDRGAPPLDTTAQFKLAQVQNGLGFVVVARTLDLGAGPQHIVFNLMLQASAAGWRVFREQAVVIGSA